MPWQNADERERDGRHDHERYRKRLEPAYDQHIDEQQHDGEGESKIAKDFDRHLPFTVPLDRRLGESRGLHGVVARDAGAVDSQLVELRIHGEDRVHWRLDLFGDIARHIDRWTEILSHTRTFACSRHHCDKPGERLWARCRCDGQREQCVHRRPLFERQARNDGALFTRRGRTHDTGGRTRQCEVQRLGDLLYARAGLRRTDAIDAEGALLLRCFHGPVDVHDPRRRLEHVLHLRRRLEPR